MVKKSDMAQYVNITIDGKNCIGKQGDTILQIARANDVYIPTLCYLSKVKPIASCRMCLVEIQGSEGVVLSCQERAVEGTVITTDSKMLYKHRQNIMKLFGVNHPLECGVCDKSGECDLQNKTLEFDVATQNFCAKESDKKVENWGFISYDPSLCIVCEKCVRICNEIVGESILEVAVGGYKSRIINTNKEADCSNCGECMAVCPVGALTNSEFKYSSNAWELERIPATCVHCSSGCPLYYEVKPSSTANREESIYRVTNPFEFSSLCGAGRFAYDFANKDAKKDKEAFTRALKAFEGAKSIRFSANITNEEALILQKLKEKKGYKLICDEARNYQKFLAAYSMVSGKSLYSGDLATLKDSDAIIIFGTRINDDNPMVKYHISMASKWHRARVAYLHPMEDVSMSKIVTQFIKYEVGSEEGVVALLANAFLSDLRLSDAVKEYLESLDVGNLSAESNVGEEELEGLVNSFEKKNTFSFVIGADLYAHPRAQEIAKVLALFEKYLDCNVILTPPASNALGVALICNLDDEDVNEQSIGYNVKGDFTLGSLGEVDLDMPALNQQEGTLTTIDKRVVATHVALPFGGYVLNDIANALGLETEYTIDYTKELPKRSGYKAVEFDTLNHEFSKEGNDIRGYLLETKDVKIDEIFEEIEELPAYDGGVVYWCNEGIHFTYNTLYKYPASKYLKGSKQFAVAMKISDGEELIFENEKRQYRRIFKLDETMKGTIAITSSVTEPLEVSSFKNYRYTLMKLQEDGVIR
ncbi:MAG: (2Fe-2S)-binding protein [Campylobacterales bacterium]|nr:(2Fe-2S)-binding protein [Campylobacterales bacterium]